MPETPQKQGSNAIVVDETTTGLPPADGQTAEVPQPGKRKRGAPKGSQNALRHGLYASSPGTVSAYGRRCSYQFRRSVEELVMQHHGEIGVSHAALIHTAAEAVRLSIINRERHARYAEKMSLEQQLASDAAYMRLLESRDKALDKLRLDQQRRESITETLSRLVDRLD